MLDIRAVAYIAPVSEVDFASVALTIRLVNYADETGLVTGGFRVYNSSTGLLIHQSDIIPVSVAAGVTVDVSSLTDFDPPAPADDTYFVLFDGSATNALVPDGIGIHLSKLVFDVKAQGMGPAPATHHLTHQEGGSDVIEVADMGTTELDDTLVLQPDGAFGVAWVAIPAVVTDHDLLNNLAYATAGHTGFAATAHDHQGEDLKFVKVHPNADSTTALQILKANDTTVILNVDSTNSRVGLGTSSPNAMLHILTSGVANNLKLDSTGSGVSGISVATDDVIKGYWACARGSGEYFTDATAGDMIFRSEACDILFGRGTGYSSLAVVGDSIGINTASPTAKLDINSNIIRLRTAKTPASAGAAGNTGDICWDADYIYVCIAANTWVRVETQTW